MRPESSQECEEREAAYVARRMARRLGTSATAAECDAFVTALAGRTHDRYYQPIALPNGITIPGYERTAETWNAIRRAVDFRDRVTLDAGCYHGLCTFGMEDAGAREVTGIDRSPDAIATAEGLRRLWRYRATLLCADLDTWTPLRRYDVALCTNVLHHAANPERAVAVLFGAADLVIWEVPERFVALFAVHASHRLVRVEDGARTADLGRRRYYYERER